MKDLIETNNSHTSDFRKDLRSKGLGVIAWHIGIAVLIGSANLLWKSLRIDEQTSKPSTNAPVPVQVIPTNEPTPLSVVEIGKRQALNEASLGYMTGFVDGMNLAREITFGGASNREQVNITANRMHSNYVVTTSKRLWR